MYLGTDRCNISRDFKLTLPPVHRTAYHLTSKEMARLTFTSLLLSLASVSSGVCNAQPIACATGAHIIVARASTEPPGTGALGIIANRVAGRIPGSEIVAVDYPATLKQYPDSETVGVNEMRRLVVEYASACPGRRIVLMGYSQVRSSVGLRGASLGYGLQIINKKLIF